MSLEVSVVVLNYNGKKFIDDCLQSLAEQTLPADTFEVVFVDNGSSDDSVAHVRANWPTARVLPLKTNLGFAGGINAGVKFSKGVYVALINNDAKAHPDWLCNGIAGFQHSQDVAMVGSKILTLDGKTIDYAGGALSFYGHGFKVGVNEPDEGQYDRPGETLFASGCALFMPRDLFLDVGGFDDEYFAFFEDVDLGWRLWIMGYRVLYEPTSLVYHRHHGTAEGLGEERERFLLERNALMTMMKNYQDRTLDASLAPATMLAIERALTYASVERKNYNLASPEMGPVANPQEMSPMAMSHLLAISEVARNMPAIQAKRDFVQERRKRSDSEIMSLFQEPLRPNISDPEFAETFRQIVSSTGLDKVFQGRTRVLVITGDTVSAKMAGPAIRAWEMATELSRKHEVRLLVVKAADITPKTFEMDVLNDATLPDHLDWADVVLFQGFIMHHRPIVGESGKILIADLYDPFHLENLEMFRQDDAGKRRNIFESDLEVITAQLRSCDFFICASEKQRDFWLGQLAGAERLNPHIYDRDPTLRTLIDVVPFGLPSDTPIHQKQVLKGVIPGIGVDDKVVLWGGGIYNWFDPLTLIRAIERVSRDHPEVKLFFMGLAHPNPDVPEMRMAAQAHDLAEDLGLLGKHVFFNQGWVPYQERANYLLEADIGVSCHLEHIETTYSYRTRVLDYFWSELPVIVTRGDALSQLVEERKLGLTVSPGSVEGFTEALTRMLEDEEMAREFKLNVGKLRPELTWAQILKPLDAFCSNPQRAADLLDIDRTGARISTRRRLIARMSLAWDEGGVLLVARRAAGYLNRNVINRGKFY